MGKSKKRIAVFIASTTIVFFVVLALQYKMWISSAIDNYGRQQWAIASGDSMLGAAAACRAKTERDYKAHTGSFTEPLHLRGTETEFDFLQRNLSLCDRGAVAPPNFHPNWTLQFVQDHIAKAVGLLIADIIIAMLFSATPVFLLSHSCGVREVHRTHRLVLAKCA